MSSVTIEAPPANTALLDTNEIRVDGRSKVLGEAVYTADIQLPNALWAAYTRSPYAFARIISIDTSAAKEVPGVRAVLTWHDIGKLRFGRQMFDWPVLCYDTVRFIGDRVAAIAADTRDAAEAAAALVDVRYEELEPMLTPEASLLPTSPAIHPDWDSYRYLAYLETPRPQRFHRNIQGRSTIEKGDGDIEAIFSTAHRIYEHSFNTPRQHCGYIEPHATLVWVDRDDTVHIHTPNKSPFQLREQLASVIGIPVEKIVIETNSIGGDFGGKGLTIDEYTCYFLAKSTGRPVRHVQRYSEELHTNNTRHPSTVRLRTAVSASGSFLAHETKIVYDGGAYAAAKVVPDLLMGGGTVGYQIPNVRLDLQAVYTNSVPCGHMRSPADVQTFFAWEQHVDIIAHDLKIDPLELRMLNVMRAGQTAITGERMREPIGFQVLERLRLELTSAPKLSARQGRGLAFVCRHTGEGKTAMRVSFEADGFVHVLTGNPDQGSGGHTMIVRVIAATMSISPDRVILSRKNTASTPLDCGTGASRVTHVGGRAAKDGAEQLRAILEKRSGMVLCDDFLVDPKTDKRQTLEEAAAQLCASGPIEVIGSYDGNLHHKPDTTSDYSFSAFSIVVEVDIETGALDVVDALLVTDVGQIINPLTHQGQIDGGFIFGIGGALMEEMPLDESGRIAVPSLNDYKLPTMKDIPPFRTVHVHTPIGHGPFGAKMAGELSNSGVAPAIANAIFQAANVRLHCFPLTAERVYEALTKKAEASERV
jgi:CO/xanthine dehydrogenase Mo-binding subunit